MGKKQQELISTGKAHLPTSMTFDPASFPFITGSKYLMKYKCKKPHVPLSNLLPSLSRPLLSICFLWAT